LSAFVSTFWYFPCFSVSSSFIVSCISSCCFSCLSLSYIRWCPEWLSKILPLSKLLKSAKYRL
jgi:hypothetical protein